MPAKKHDYTSSNNIKPSSLLPQYSPKPLACNPSLGCSLTIPIAHHLHLLHHSPQSFKYYNTKKRELSL
uniref:Uncharacterized protein n=1 Tax=Daucus carota subsp. sativus TaxID=79200 RepID=A0A175YQW2_DAUCS